MKTTETCPGLHIKHAIAVRFLGCMIGMRKKMEDIISKKWRHLSGQTYWKDLLDPLDFDLRRYSYITFLFAFKYNRIYIRSRRSTII